MLSTTSCPRDFEGLRRSIAVTHWRKTNISELRLLIDRAYRRIEDVVTMIPAFSNTIQGAIIASTFLVPLLTYIYFTRTQKQKNRAGPLPEATEVTALYIHPIKSCHGIQVQSAKLLPTGLDLGTVNLTSQDLTAYTDILRSPMDVGNLPQPRIPHHSHQRQNDVDPPFLQRLNRYPDRHCPSPRLYRRETRIQYPCTPK